MSPQGIKAQAIVAQLAAYNPAMDTRNKSFFSFLKKQADKCTESGYMAEAERNALVPQLEQQMERCRALTSQKRPAVSVRSRIDQKTSVISTTSRVATKRPAVSSRATTAVRGRTLIRA